MRKELFLSLYLVLIGMLSISFLLPSKIVVEPTRVDLPADGLSRSPVRLRVQMPLARRIFFPHPRITAQIVQGPDFVSLFPLGEVWLGQGGASYFIKSRAAEGEAVIRFQVHNATAGEVRVFTHTVNTDSNLDGFPDSFKLNSFTDRQNFRRGFTAIAHLQYFQISPDWADDQRDGAGLVRFALREALRKHTEGWQRRFSGLSVLPSIEKYSFPLTPLGDKIFRTRPGAYQPTDLADGTFSDFADAKTLRQFNATFIGRDRNSAQKGDLIFFSTPWVRSSPYLVMIFVKDAPSTDAGQADWVVYQTDPTPGKAGQMRRARLASLDQETDRRLRPIESNKYFLGYFRLKVLE